MAGLRCHAEDGPLDGVQYLYGVQKFLRTRIRPQPPALEMDTMTRSTSTTIATLRTWLLWTAGFVAFPIAGLAGTAVAGRVDDAIAGFIGGTVAGPCATALVEAGVARVVYAQSDHNPVAVGGAETLKRAGVDVEEGLLVDEARTVNPVWTFAVEHGRPFVTWKFATTLDGRSAAADGTSRWVSSRAARLDTHRLRGLCDTILVGTGTVLVDDPQLTVRDEHDVNLPRERQLLRAVMGLRELPAGRRVLDDAAETVVLRTRDPHEALADLFARDRQHVFLEGGPGLAAAFLGADLVDEVVAYVAPMLLGSGHSVVGDLGITTIADARHLEVTDVAVVGDGAGTNVRITMRPLKEADA